MAVDVATGEILTIPGERGLETIASEIRWHEQQAQGFALNAIEHKAEIGKRLIEAKALLPHGQFLPWAESEFGWGPTWVSKHMILARNFHRAESLGPGASMRMALAAIQEAKDADRDALRAQHDLLEAPPLDDAVGVYPILYADPPWRYEHVETENRAIENHYPTMTIEEICSLPVRAVSADDSVLFLWATSPKLAEAMKVIDAWGFDYRTCMVWVKDKIGMGYYARQRHELLLIARRGELPVPEPENRPDSVLVAPRLEHSAKPPEFYDLIERMYPGQRYLELFARTAREGWVAWGNQAPEGEEDMGGGRSRVPSGIGVQSEG